MSTFALGKYLVWSRQNGDGGTTFYYYYDEITWVVAVLALAWVAWWLARRHMRERAARRPRRRRTDYGLLRRVVTAKSELSARYLRPGFSANIHAVGVGVLGDRAEYCIQVFISDADAELWAGAGAAALPDSHGGFPVVPVVARPAVLLSGAEPEQPAAWEQYPNGIRDRREVIIGGISGANTNLTGQSGTIGYFCKRKSILPRPTEVYLLSNSHVLADLRKEKVDDGDLITQPSPGEPASNRPIGALVNFSSLKFDGGTDEPNHVDAAVARLWATHRYERLIPFIGEVKGYVVKRDVAVGEVARKFGRTTGYTEGRVFSIYLDIRVRYDRTGQSAFFRDQFLIEPALPRFTKFVDTGDSGSLVVDEAQHAVGLIFAGTPDAPDPQVAAPPAEPTPEAAGGNVTAADRPLRIENYGVANPISEVLERLRVELLI
ncbi:MAG TPA: hypothetical protein VF588_06010 [Pyrinomonadaceae bacterium]|jgi:hypothetical protein